jgi:hypothetical protein
MTNKEIYDIVNRIENKLDALCQNVCRHDERIEEASQRIEVVNKRINTVWTFICWFVGVSSTIIGGVVGFIEWVKAKMI